MKCSNCGQKLHKKNRFCPKCGFKRKRNIKKILVTVSVLVLLTVGVSMAVLFGMRHTESGRELLDQTAEDLMIEAYLKTDYTEEWETGE